MVRTKIRKLVNPEKRAPRRRLQAPKNSQSRRRSRKATEKNPAVFTLGFVNPQRKKQTMAKATTPTRRNGKKASRRRKNPVVFLQKTRKAQNPRRSAKPRRKRNPEGVSLSGSVGMLKFGLWALFGLIITRQAPQLALGARNTGWAGYGANFATALLAYFGAKKTVGKEAAQAIGTGGMLYFAERILREKFTPIGQALSLTGCGDASALPSGLRGVNVRDIYSPMPVRHDRAGNPIIPREIDAAAAVAAMAAANKPAPASVSGVSRISIPSRVSAIR